ncbi:MAG: DUF4446 family protein [Candidatus Sungbacteria bacterium]|nr:DUF4446 family protein [Candidatus Sungbacteria bacterium]
MTESSRFRMSRANKECGTRQLLGACGDEEIAGDKLTSEVFVVMQEVLSVQFFLLLGLMLGGFSVLGKLLLNLKRRVDRVFGKGGGSADPQENFMRRVVNMEDDLQKLFPRIDQTEARSNISIQHIGFLRFNPFADTGGDNSFVLVLTDAGYNGVMISSLYLRDGMRVYAKPIEAGRTRYPLSAEESRALAQAIGKGSSPS